MTMQQPTNMHTDSVSACNMHTDLTIDAQDDGGVCLTGKDSTGATRSVRVSQGIAGKLGTAAGLPGAPAPTPAPSSGTPVAPMHMHTDDATDAIPATNGNSVRLVGPADEPDGSSTNLTVTFDGSALTTLRNARGSGL